MVVTCLGAHEQPPTVEAVSGVGGHGNAAIVRLSGRQAKRGVEYCAGVEVISREGRQGRGHRPQGITLAPLVPRRALRAGAVRDVVCCVHHHGPAQRALKSRTHRLRIGSNSDAAVMMPAMMAMLGTPRRRTRYQMSQ